MRSYADMWKRADARRRRHRTYHVESMLFEECVNPVCASARDVLDLLAEIERKDRALVPFAAFADAWDEKPLLGLSDDLYNIHGYAGATLRLSDCQKARAALAPAKDGGAK